MVVLAETRNTYGWSLSGAVSWSVFGIGAMKTILFSFATTDTAGPSADVSVPIRKSTLSFRISSRATRTASLASALESRTISSILRPSTPPLAFNSSTNIMAPLDAGSPNSAGGPERGRGTPTLIGFWALAARGVASTRASSIVSTRSIMESLLWLREIACHEPPALHHRQAAPVLQHRDVLQGIAAHHHEIGELADLERADPVLHPHELGARPGVARDGLERGEADDVHEDLDVLRVLAVRVPGEAEIAARAHADPQVPGPPVRVRGLLDLIAQAGGADDRLGDSEARPVLDDRVEVAQPRHQGQTLVGDQAQRLVVRVGRVLDRIHAGLGGHAARAGPAHVGRGQAAAHVGLLDQPADLVEGIGAVRDGSVGQQRVAPHVALDHVGAVLDRAAHRGPDLVGPVRDEGESGHAELEVGRIPVRHAAGGHDVAARREQARARG